MLGICGGDASPVIIPQLSPETSNIYGNDFLETISRRRARQRDMLTDDGFVRVALRTRAAREALPSTFVSGFRAGTGYTHRRRLENRVRIGRSTKSCWMGFGVEGLRPEQWSRESI